MSVLPHRVTLQKLTTTVTSGGKLRSYADRVANVACLVTQQSGAGEAGQTHTVTFATQGTEATDVGVGDRVYVTAGPGFTTGKYLAVQSITQHGGVGGISAFTRLQCKQVLSSFTPGG